MRIGRDSRILIKSSISGDYEIVKWSHSVLIPFNNSKLLTKLSTIWTLSACSTSIYIMHLRLQRKRFCLTYIVCFKFNNIFDLMKQELFWCPSKYFNNSFSFRNEWKKKYSNLNHWNDFLSINVKLFTTI